MVEDAKDLCSNCRSSGVDYSKKTKYELVTELEAFEKDNRALRVDLQKYQLLKLELVHTRTARDDDRLCANDTSEQVKVRGLVTALQPLYYDVSLIFQNGSLSDVILCLCD